MKKSLHRKRSKRLKHRLKSIAAVVAGAAIMSSAMLPGVPAATAHASANPNVDNQPAPAIQQVIKTPTGFLTKKINLKRSPRAPEQKAVQAQAKAEVQNEQTQNAASPPTSDTKAKRDKAPRTVVAKPAAAKDVPNFRQVLNVTATAYAPGAHDNDQWGDKTFLGTKVRPGVIAVDPNVIPLGSRVYIEFPDGTGTYAVAEDTGGAIKGNRIDIAMNSVDQAEDFGIKNVKVYILDTQKA